MVGRDSSKWSSRFWLVAFCSEQFDVRDRADGIYGYCVEIPILLREDVRTFNLYA